MDFKNKKVLIFGLGRYREGSGVSAARFFIRRGARVTVTDMKTARELRETVAMVRGKVTLHLGGHKMEDVRAADIIMRNPGVPHDSPYLAQARRLHIPIYTDASLFMMLAPCPVIGVTGTRGKSTTTALIGEIVKRKNKKTFVGGNIQRSPLTFLDKLDTNSLVVLELSSWLLESFADIKKSPQIAVVTNIYPDHLNVHGSMRAYIRAKENIFRFQKSGDLLFLNQDNPDTRDMKKRAAHGVYFSVKNVPSWLDWGNVTLAGDHNKSNVLAAVVVALAVGVPQKEIGAVLKSFRGLSSRQEIVRVVRGVTWVNDTTATTPEATIAALHRFAPNGKIILIAGGTDKKLQFGALAREIKKQCKSVILFDGTATVKLMRELGIMNYELGITIVRTMADAVRRTQKIAERGDVILLSPGAASFGLFKNEFDRGDQFFREVNRITPPRLPLPR